MKAVFFSSLIFCLVPLGAWAQARPQLRTEGALRQLEATQQRPVTPTAPQFRAANTPEGTAPELYPGESSDLGPQMLLSGSDKPPKRSWIEVAADVQYLYTSNMFLTEQGNTDTGVLISTLQVALAPDPFDFKGGQLALRAGYRQQRFNYGLDDTSNLLNNFDFDVGSAFVSASYTFQDVWTASVEVDYNRLLSHEQHYAEFYTECLIAWGLERRVTINDTNSLQLTYLGGQHLTHADSSPSEPSTSVNDRTDTILGLTWNYQFNEKLTIQPYYRFQYTHYWEKSSRNDYFHTLGVTVAYAVKDWLSVRFFTSWEKRESNDHEIMDYEKFDTGGGVSLLVRF